jgi:Protein of unknown function (DUF2865)
LGDLPVHRGCIKPLRRAGLVLATAFVVVGLTVPGPARAGFLDFLFGGFHQDGPSSSVRSYAEPSAPTRGEGEYQGGRGVVFCVRLCDGQHFPLERSLYATPVETCRAMCPASKTKVFFGSAIDHAAARDGQRYTDLDNAYVYRDHLVPDCTCNGKDAFGLAPYDSKYDPTLRPGDIVATKDGFVAFTGKRGGQVAEFTPVNPATLALGAGAKPQAGQLARRGAEPSPQAADDEPGTVVQQPPAGMQADLHGQAR